MSFLVAHPSLPSFTHIYNPPTPAYITPADTSLDQTFPPHTWLRASGALLVLSSNATSPTEWGNSELLRAVARSGGESFLQYFDFF